MKHIFYFIGICFILYEISWLISPIEHVEDGKKFKDLTKQNKGKKWDDYSKDYKDMLISKGLPSILFDLIIILPLGKLFKFSFAYTVLHWLNSAIGLLFGIFVIINSYNLKLNLYEIIRSLFLN